MKFEVTDTKDSLAKALYITSRVSPRYGKAGTFNPALSCLRIEAIKPERIKIMGTDGYTYVIALANADVIEEGEAIVNASKTANFVFSKPGELEAHTTKIRLIMSTPNKSKVMVNFYSGKGGLPPTPDIPIGATRHVIKGEILRKLMHVRTMANTRMSATGHLTGVLLEMSDDKVYSCALNGYCFGMSWFPYQSDGNKRFLLHHLSAREIIRVVNDDDNIHLYIHKNKLFVVSDYYYIVCQSIHGADKYPVDQVKQFFDWEMDMEASFAGHKLVDAFNAAKDIAEDDIDIAEKNAELRRMRFSIEQDSALLKTSEKSQSGYAEYILGVRKFTGSPREVVIDSQYTGNLIDSLKHLQDSMMVLGDKGATTNLDIKVAIKGHWSFFSSEQSNTLYGMAGVKE